MMAADLKQKMRSDKLLQFSTSFTRTHSFGKLFICDNHKLLLISTGGRTLHVLSGDTVLVTVHCPLGIQDACIATSESAPACLLVLSPSGTISRTSLDSVVSEKTSGRTSAEDDSIFDELLQEDNDRGSTEASITLKDEDIILHNPEAKQLAILNDYLITIEPWKVHIYTREGRSTSKDASFIKIASHFMDNIPEDASGSQENVQLVFLCPTTLSLSMTNPSRHYIIEKTLFLHLFGSDLSLLQIPVLLVGYASGHVYSITIHRQTAGNPQPPQLFCDLQQPVTGIFGLHSCSDTSIAKHSEKLCILGRHGKLIVIESSVAESKEWLSKEFYLIGPITSAALIERTLIHSSGCQFLITNLKQLESKENHSHLTSEAFNGGLATCIIGCKGDTKQSLEWLSLNKRGHLYRHHLAQVETDAQNQPKTTSSRGSLKDLLTGISKSSDDLVKVQGHVAQLDGILSQLSLAGYIAATHCGDLKDVPLKLTASVERENLGPNTVLKIRVRVVNQSATRLLDGWTLVIVLTTDHQPREESVGNLSKTVPLACHGKGDHQDVLIPLEQSQIDSIPLKVETFVSYAAKTAGGVVSADNMVTLPLRGLTIDILHCLEPTPLSQRPVPRGLGTTSDLRLVQLASTRPCRMDLSETREDSFPLKTGQLTLKKLVQENKVQNNLGKNAMTIEARLLQHLVDNSHVTILTEQSHVALRSIPGGHQVSLSVRRCPAQEGTLEVVWETDDLWTLSQLHTAITCKLERLSGVLDSLRSHAVVAKSEEVGRQAMTLKDQICEMGNQDSHFSKDITSLFITLRNMSQ